MVCNRDRSYTFCSIWDLPKLGSNDTLWHRAQLYWSCRRKRVTITHKVGEGWVIAHIIHCCSGGQFPLLRLIPDIWKQSNVPDYWVAPKFRVPAHANIDSDVPKIHPQYSIFLKFGVQAALNTNIHSRGKIEKTLFWPELPLALPGSSPLRLIYKSETVQNNTVMAITAFPSHSKKRLQIFPWLRFVVLGAELLQELEDLRTSKFQRLPERARKVH